jgi:hypothetical protein
MTVHVYSPYVYNSISMNLSLVVNDTNLLEALGCRRDVCRQTDSRQNDMLPYFTRHLKSHF